MNTQLRLTLDMGPLVAFFVTYFVAGIYVATGVLVVCTLVAAVVYKVKTGKVPLGLIITAVVVTVFGALTIAFNDDRFIKIKPTIIYAMFAGILFFGLATGKSYLRLVFETAFPPMEPEGWRKLTFRFAWMFVAMAILNEIVWRSFSESFWVSFKLFGVTPIMVLFVMAQVRLFDRYALEDGSTS